MKLGDFSLQSHVIGDVPKKRLDNEAKGQVIVLVAICENFKKCVWVFCLSICPCTIFMPGVH